jgi:hypothetical protein
MMLLAVLGVFEPKTPTNIPSPPFPYHYTEQDGGGAYGGHTTHSGTME